MKQTIYYTTVNAGDGSSYVSFYESQECIDLLEEADPEAYGDGEGGASFTIDGTHNIQDIQTLEDVKKDIEEMQ